MEVGHSAGTPRWIGGIEHHERTDRLFPELVLGFYTWQEGFPDELLGKRADVDRQLASARDQARQAVYG